MNSGEIVLHDDWPLFIRKIFLQATCRAENSAKQLGNIKTGAAQNRIPLYRGSQITLAREGMDAHPANY
jgi:hypothetical protein